MNKIMKKTKKTAATIAAMEPNISATHAVAKATVETQAAKTRPGTVSFALMKPGAKQVSVAGSFNGWKAEANPLQPAGKDRWVGDLTVTPGRHEYLFVVDGQWLPDPNAPQSVQNPFGGRNSVLVVSE